MTVTELIVALSALPPDATILAPCCINPYNGHPIEGALSVDAHGPDHGRAALVVDDMTDVDLEA